MSGQRFARKLAFTIVLAVTLAGCTQEIEETVGECEPGVSEISRVETAPPPVC